MTNIIKLFSGIGVIIDDAIFEDGSSLNGIQKIAKSLKKNHIPLLEYNELPDDEFINQFHGISFVILDWNLSGEQPIPGATINDNIAFINKLKTVCFVPLFIFSDENSHDIQVNLEAHNLLLERCPIFIKKKNELDTAEKLFSEIEHWLKQTPSIYVMKEWEKATREAKTKMLWSLSSIHPAWPSVLSKSIKTDGGDGASELMRLLHNNLSYRLEFPEFDEQIIEAQKDGVGKNELRKLLECERFVPKESLPPHPFAGDIYLIDDKYYLNIRPDCDIIRRPKDMYLIEGKVVDETKINTEDQHAIRFKNGEFIEKKTECYVGFVKGNILRFCLRDMDVMVWKKIKEYRIGRLLPPYITLIQQKYAFYIQRQGLPAIPEEAVKES
ncbi:MAG: hypothetical protein J6N95_02020 [Bacilli bacterium]|nr:hypothetical protein [Bacilli bacterium]